jgi:CBS domain containing-hemolysin-like protein
VSGAVLIWIGLFALGLACFASMAAYALRDFSRVQLRELLRDRDALPLAEEIVERHRQAALGAETVRALSAAVAVMAATAFLWQRPADQGDAPISFGVAAILMLVGAVLLCMFVVWLPTALARIWAEPFIVSTWAFWRTCGRVFAPASAGALLVDRAVERISGKPTQNLSEEELEEEIREVVTEGQREGLIEEDAREMIESVMALGEVLVKEIMTPRTDMISMSAEISWDEAMQFVIASGHTRIPVYGKSRDDIVGILHIKDMLHELARASESAHRAIADLLRPPYFVPESKPVDDLLQEFQRSRNHLAIVLDEFAGVSGMVTIEDVLEEIVGEIADEHDEAAGEGIKQIDENSSEAAARVPIAELNERLGLHLPEVEHFGTIGGFVFHQLGRIPHVGEELTYDGVKIKVLEATRRRINRVAIELVPPAEDADEASSESGVRSSE